VEFYGRSHPGSAVRQKRIGQIGSNLERFLLKIPVNAESNRKAPKRCNASNIGSNIGFNRGAI
jgi:hypothetical protein